MNVLQLIFLMLMDFILKEMPRALVNALLFMLACCEELLIRPRAPPDTARSKEHYANLEIYVPTSESSEEAWLPQPIV